MQPYGNTEREAVRANQERWFPKWLGYWMTIARPLRLSLFLSLLQTTKTNTIKLAEKMTKCDLFWFEQIICDLNLAAEISMVTGFLAVWFCAICVQFFFSLISSGCGRYQHALQPLILPHKIPDVPVRICICAELRLLLEESIYLFKRLTHEGEK